MKTIILSLFCFLFASVAFAQDQASSANTPSFRWTSGTEKAFGKIKQSVPVETVFEFANTGGAPLILTHVQASCGCTTPEWTKEPIMPGETGTIKVIYNAANLGGFNKTITVTSNTGAQVVLRISGEVVAE